MLMIQILQTKFLLLDSDKYSKMEKILYRLLIKLAERINTNYIR